VSTDTLMWIAVVGLIGVAAFLALSETSLTRVNRVKAMALEEEGEHLLRFVEPEAAGYAVEVG
jgi:Mg2+/Co2+ transporter CorB